MTTKQEQTSTVGQPGKNIPRSNQPAQNRVRQNDLAQNGGNPAEKKPIIWETSPLGRKQYFSFKNCKTWNQYEQTGVTQYIRAEIDPHYTACAVLNIPDDPHPWNALRSVIDQFYQRERVIAWERYEAREAIKKAQQLEEKNKQLDDARWILDSRIGELKKELVQAHDKIAKLESNQPAEIPTRLNLLDELLAISDAEEWVDITGGILDCVIGLSCYEDKTVSGSDLYFTRRLQEFFMKLDKATDHDTDNHNISLEDIDTASKFIQ